MPSVVNLGRINLQYMDRGLFERSFRAECKTRLSAAAIYHALDSVIQTKDIIEIGRTDGLAWNIVVGNDVAADILRQVGVIEINGTFTKVVSVSRQTIEVRCHWLPSYVKDEFLRFLFADFGKVLDIRRETTVIGAGLEKQNGIRVVVLETDDVVKANIPHLVKCEGGISMLITMNGRPPLCLRCQQVGHVRRDCNTFINLPAQSTRKTYASAVGTKTPQFSQEPQKKGNNQKPETPNNTKDPEDKDPEMDKEDTKDKEEELLMNDDTEEKEVAKDKEQDNDEEMEKKEKTYPQGIRRSWEDTRDSGGFDLEMAAEGHLEIDFDEHSNSSTKRSKLLEPFDMICVDEG